MIFVCTTEAKACSITSLLCSSPLQPFQGCTSACIPLVLVPQPACKIFSSPCVFFVFTILNSIFAQASVLYFFTVLLLPFPPCLPLQKMIVRIFHWYLWFQSDGPRWNSKYVARLLATLPVVKPIFIVGVSPEDWLCSVRALGLIPTYILQCWC